MYIHVLMMRKNKEASKVKQTTWQSCCFFNMAKQHSTPTPLGALLHFQYIDMQGSLVVIMYYLWFLFLFRVGLEPTTLYTLGSRQSTLPLSYQCSRPGLP